MAKRKCGECGAKITGNQRSGYCRECMKHRCRHCAEPIPAERLGRASRPTCRECSRKGYLRKVEKLAADPRCWTCKKPIEPWRRNPTCAECRREEYEAECRSLLKFPLRCRNCQAELPRGRRNRLCAPCHGVHRRNLPNQQKPCHICRTRMRAPGAAYCSPCKTLYENWRYAYRAGDPHARRLRTKQDYVRWQQGETP